MGPRFSLKHLFAVTAMAALVSFAIARKVTAPDDDTTTWLSGLAAACIAGLLLPRGTLWGVLVGSFVMFEEVVRLQQSLAVFFGGVIGMVVPMAVVAFLASLLRKQLLPPSSANNRRRRGRG